jgi:hypothetical protein
MASTNTRRGGSRSSGAENANTGMGNLTRLVKEAVDKAIKEALQPLKRDLEKRIEEVEETAIDEDRMNAFANDKINELVQKAVKDAIDSLPAPKTPAGVGSSCFASVTNLINTQGFPAALDNFVKEKMWDKGIRLINRKVNNFNSFPREFMKTCYKISDERFLADATPEVAKLVEKSLNARWNCLTSNYRVDLTKCKCANITAGM